MPGDHVADPDRLTDEQREQLDENWALTNHTLDDLIERWLRHRAQGCPHWFCMDGDTANLVADLELHQVQQLLRAAVERLIHPLHADR